MTEEELDLLIEMIKKHFEELGWEDKDVDLGLGWLSVTILFMYKHELPYDNIKYAEVLRALANTLDIIFIQKSQKSKD